MQLKDKIKLVKIDSIQSRWKNYIEELELNNFDINELIIILKEGNIEEITGGVNNDYSSLHAWRALAQLKAIESFKDIINIGIEQPSASWLIIELSDIIPLMGYEIIDEVETYLDELEEEERLDILKPVIKGLVKLGFKDLKAKEKVKELLNNKLSDYKFNYDTYNSYLANALIQLKDLTSVTLIEEAIDNYRIHYEEFDEEGFESLLSSLS